MDASTQMSVKFNNTEGIFQEVAFMTFFQKAMY